MQKSKIRRAKNQLRAPSNGYKQRMNRNQQGKKEGPGSDRRFARRVSAVRMPRSNGSSSLTKSLGVWWDNGSRENPLSLQENSRKMGKVVEKETKSKEQARMLWQNLCEKCAQQCPFAYKMNENQPAICRIGYLTWPAGDPAEPGSVDPSPSIVLRQCCGKQTHTRGKAFSSGAAGTGGL